MNEKEINEIEHTQDDDVSFETTDSEGVEETQNIKIKKLREEIEKLRKERDEYLVGWQRAKADYINQSKNHLEERSELSKSAARKTITGILPTLDTYDLAKGNTEAWNSVDANWRTGIEYIFQQLYTSLENEGLKKFGAVGDKFDPKLHQSIEAIPVSDKIKDGTVVAVLQSGYMLHEKVIRPAKVNVGIYKEQE
jgi:molecular chaperone GrpE